MFFLFFQKVLREVETLGIRHKRGSQQYNTAMKESLKKFLPQEQKAHKVNKTLYSLVVFVHGLFQTQPHSLQITTFFPC